MSAETPAGPAGPAGPLAGRREPLHFGALMSRLDVSGIVHGRRVGRSGKHWAYVFAGGAVGAGARAGAEKALPTDPGEFPWPTLTINLIGAFILVWAATRLARHPRPRERAFLISGFCGGLTTFATMQLELVRLIDHGDGWIALAYGVTSIVAGVIVARGAFLLASRAAVSE